MVAMAIARWKDLCIDASDAHRMARFWGELLGLEVELHGDGDAALRGRLRRAARERRASLRGWSATTSVLAGVLSGAAR